MLNITQAPYIKRMQNGESLLRIGSIWYGDTDDTTVSNLYYFGNKNMSSVMPIRAESAISFSNTMPSIDTMNIEIIVNTRAFATHIQRLTAQLQISPVLPVLNVAIAATVQPVQLHKRAYMAYGFDDIDEMDINLKANEYIIKKMYASVPIQMRVDNMRISNVPGTTGEIMVVLTVTKALTANIYGDVVKYVLTKDDAIYQSKQIDEAVKSKGDDSQTDAVATMFGIDIPEIRRMISHMLGKSTATFEEGGTMLPGETVSGHIIEFISSDIYRVALADGSEKIITPFGIETYNTQTKLNYFGFNTTPKQANIVNDNLAIEFIKGFVGVSAIDTSPTFEFTQPIGPYGMTDTSNTNSSINKLPDKELVNVPIKFKIIYEGSMSQMDSKSILKPNGNTHIAFCNILVNNPPIDLGNVLIESGHAVVTDMYNNDKLTDICGNMFIEEREKYINKYIKSVIEVFKYDIAYGANKDKKPKICTGDKRTPEGIYKITGIDSMGASKSSKSYTNMKARNSRDLKAEDGHHKYKQYAVDLGKDAYGEHFFRLNYPNNNDKTNYIYAKQKGTATTSNAGNGIAIHGTSDPGSIGHLASSGCIRIGKDDLTKFKKFVSIGGTVVIERLEFKYDNSHKHTSSVFIRPRPNPSDIVRPLLDKGENIVVYVDKKNFTISGFILSSSSGGTGPSFDRKTIKDRVGTSIGVGV